MKIFPKAAAVATVAVALVAGALAASGPATALSPQPSGSTANELAYLKSISGKYVLSGQHNREPNSAPAQWTNKVHDITGVYPAIWSGDFLYESDNVASRQSMVNEAKSEWAAGSLVSLVWHVCPPTTGSSCDWSTGIESHLSDSQWTQLTTNGTSLNSAWKARLDEAVPYLQQLKTAGVPVLWRFLHEINDGWSWWGGRPGANGSAKLLQLSHDYLVNTKGLTNLIWVWNVKDDDPAGYAGYYPGSSYADVVSLDAWNANFPSAGEYNTLSGIAAGKPLALAEVGTLPTAAQLAGQPLWTWFNDWAEYLTSNNSNTAIQNLYYNSRVLHRGDVSLPTSSGPATGPITGLAGKCVDDQASVTGNGNPIQLYACNGTAAQQWTVGSDGTLRAFGKCLDVTGQYTANGSTIQLWDCNGQTNQRWTVTGSTLVSAASGRCLDVPGGNSADGTRLQIWDCNGNAQQQWTVPGH